MRPFARPVATLAAITLGITGLVPAVTASANSDPVTTPAQIEVGGVVGFSTNPSPAFPSNFDWKQRTTAYDDFVYDWTDRGVFSTIRKDNTALNMPAGQTTYKMPAYYGDSRVSSAGSHNGDGYQESVTQLASVISATLVGIDKSAQTCNQPGGSATCNYVDMLQTFFRKDTTGVAGNTPTPGGPGVPGTDDGWYQMLPNVLYSMIGEQYPNAQNMDNIQRSIANNFYDMIVNVGGANASFAMWDYNFVTKAKYQSPQNSGRYQTAEIATAAAAIQLFAYERFGDAKYLQGAKWAMDSLERETSNTYYEILVILTPYLAARMNAEYGTNYDVAKYFRWLMEGSDARGGWGTIGSLGKSTDPSPKWGSYDVAGLSGSLNDQGFDGDSNTTGYAFAMNSFSTTWLAATAKYDTRYANSVGKWLLNVNNASRFYFADQVSANQQFYGNDYLDGVSSGQPGSSAGWATDDRAAAIAYEGFQPHNSKGIYVASDVPTRSSGWGTGPDARGLGMYGSSWIGFMSVIHPTNIQNVLRIDLNALDTYGDNTYPTSLVYNPTTQTQQVQIPLAAGVKDLYDSVSHQYATRGVHGTATVTVPAGSSVVLVEVPAGATLTTSGTITKAAGSPIAFNTNAQRDLALGTHVEASAGGSTVAALTDGDPNSSWITTGNNARSATVDLGGLRSIGSVEVGWGARRPVAYTIEASANGSSWATVNVVTASQAGTSRFDLPTTAARKLRISIPSGQSGSNAVALSSFSAYEADLALGAAVAVSESGNRVHAPSAMVDGSKATRWESATADAVSAVFDLGSVKVLGRVEIEWETAAAKEYKILVSDDNAIWREAGTDTNVANGGRWTRTVTLSPATTGRYVKLQTVNRLTNYAHSIYRFSVYGTVADRPVGSAPAVGTTSALSLSTTTQQVDAAEAGRALAQVQISSATGEQPKGQVQLFAGSTSLGTVNVGDATVSGVATGSIRVPANLSVGTHQLVAKFTPDDSAEFAGSISTPADLVVTVTPKPSVRAKVSLTVAPVKSSLRVGAKPVLNVSATPSEGWTGGTVAVRVTGYSTVNVRVPASGKIQVKLPASKRAGKVTISANYTGSAAFLPATVNATATIAKSKTSTRVTAKVMGKAKARSGALLTVKVKVKGAAGVSLKGRATLTITGLTAKKTTKKVKVSTNGTVTYKVRAKRVGTVKVSAKYLGNANQSGSASKAVKVKVKR